jgi:hypothetical protein
MSGLTSHNVHFRLRLRDEIWAREINNVREEKYKNIKRECLSPFFTTKLKKGLFEIPIEVSLEGKIRHERSNQSGCPLEIFLVN